MILSHEDAFKPLPDEVSIPIDKSVHDFQFTRNWFRNRNQATFSTFLKPKFHGVKMDWSIKILQIGVFEAMDVVWQLQNTATNPDSRVYCVDPWLDTGKLDQSYMDGVEKRARHNLSPWKDKVKIFKGFSKDILKGLLEHPGNRGLFDLLVVDGDHTADAVIQDARHCLELAKVGAWILFDDVRNRVPKPDHVFHGLERFLEESGDRVKLVFRHRYCDCYEKIA